ncbi:MAG: hypothetical protein AAF539_01690 [Planctomycetota bacterium]
MADQPESAGRFFDATSETGQPPVDTKNSANPPNPFLGIRFRCCQQYGRIYRNADRTAYDGHCPRCGQRVQIPIGGGGTGARFFEAG